MPVISPLFSRSAPWLARTALLASLGFGGWVLACASAFAQAPDPPQERQREGLVKASFLHRFGSFVEWPDGVFPAPTAPLRIGVVGDDEVWKDLAELAQDRPREGRNVFVERLREYDSFAGLHVLYVKADGSARVSEILARVPPGVLTVVDSGSGLPVGGVISFLMEDGRIRFSVSLDAAAHQGLRLNSRLLALARTVQGKAP